MPLAIEDRVFASDEHRSGHGKLMYIDKKEMFGAQVLMDEPDGDGHRVYRFSLQHVRPAEEGEQLVLKRGERMMAVANSRNSSLITGEKYLIEISTYSKSTTQVNYYDLESHRHLGGCSIHCFIDIKPVDEKFLKPRKEPQKKAPVISETEPTKKQMKGFQKEATEQLSFALEF